MREPAKVGIREQRILDFVQQRTGLHIRRVQYAHAASAINRCMHRAGTSDPNDYVARLERDLAVLDELIVELVVGETYFFRFPDQFRFLSHTILPQIVERARAASSLRFWSAGCATGEEAYSIAIVLREAGLLGRAQILATDISKASIAQARRGVFQSWALRGDGRQRVEPYATCRDGSYYLNSEIREAVRFSCLNLALDTYPSPLSGIGKQDVIFCRNVLIYLAPRFIPDVAAKLFESLVPGGWLVTAASDPVLDHHAPFETVAAPGGVYYRRPVDASVVLPPSLRDEAAESSAWEVAASLPREPGESPESMIAEARAALSAGDYERAVGLTAACTDREGAGCLHVKALANSDTNLAQQACQKILAQHPLSAELHYLNAVLLMELRRDDEALAMIKRLLFLDRSQVIGHLTLGTLLRRVGDLDGACRAFRNARDLCQAQHPQRPVPLTDDETFGSVERTAVSQLASLGERKEAES